LCVFVSAAKRPKKLGALNYKNHKSTSELERKAGIASKSKKAIRFTKRYNLEKQGYALVVDGVFAVELEKKRIWKIY
jgi:hypothetical protein